MHILYEISAILFSIGRHTATTVSFYEDKHNLSLFRRKRQCCSQKYIGYINTIYEL